MLYDRDQAFGGSQLTQLISRQYGFSYEEAEQKKLAADLPDDYETSLLAPFVDSLSQEIGRALQYFFTSTPHHKVHYVMLAGGTATLPGLKDRVTELTGFASMVVNPFENMKLGSAVRESQAAPRGVVVPHGLRPGDAEVRAVIMINLLPHREERRKRAQGRLLRRPRRRRRGRRWPSSASGTWSSQQLISGQQQRNAFLQTRDRQARHPDQGHRQPAAEIASLKARQKAVEDLQIDRNVPVHVLNELVRQTPEGIYITVVKQDGQTLTVAGIAQTQERVSELLRNTAYNSEWLVKPELVESKAATVAGANTRAEAPVRLLDAPDRQAPAGHARGGGAGGRAMPPRPARRQRPPSRQEDLSCHGNQDQDRQRRPELGLRRRGLAVPRPQSERARPVADAAEGADLRWRSRS